MTILLDNKHPFKAKASGWSMLPGIFPGDWLFIEPLTHSVKTGDICVVQFESSKMIVHRLVGFTNHSPARLIFKGDHNQMTDPPVGGNHLIARVTKVRWSLTSLLTRLKFYCLKILRASLCNI